MVPVPGWFTTTTPDNTEEIRRLVKVRRELMEGDNMLMSALKNGQHTIETVRLLAEVNPEAVDQSVLKCALENKREPKLIELQWINLCSCVL